MVTIIKNQLLKHLSRYTKNLSPEQISLSALRGSGELQDLTLDEDLLTDLLELPLWVRLTSAKCNRASFRIQWTKLKTVPIVLNLDEVHIALEVCPDPRVANTNAAGSMPIPGKYSYIHKVIDGISVAVNHVIIEFKCEAFTSSVQLSRVTVESRTPDGRKADLRLTRLKNPDTGQLLIFKELEWQSARIEAKALGNTSPDLAPLRLLLGNTHCRIVIKKRLSDCQILGSRLAIRPEPIAWALTDGQVRAALACVNALAKPVKKAAAVATRAKAAKKIQEPQYSEPSAHGSATAGGDRDVLARLFAKHDVRETSYHLLAPRIDFHLCDDPGMGRSSHPSLSGGGALQVTLVGMQADFFPYHRAYGDRGHWRGYREAATPHAQWLSQSLVVFCSMLLDLLDPKPTESSNKNAPVNTSTEDEPLLSNGVHKIATNQNSSSNDPSNTTSQATPTRVRILKQLSTLMTTCLVLRIDDFTIYKVSTGSKSREPVRALVSAEKTTMPGDAGLLHAELTFFYYPGDLVLPVPPPKLYIQLAPVRISFSPQSIIWLSAMLPHLAEAMNDASQETETYCDVRAEAIMPKIVLEAGAEHVSQQRDRPRELHLCAARATLTNVRELENNSSANTRAELSSMINQFRRSSPTSGQFPTSSADLNPLHEQFLLHADKLDDIVRSCVPMALWAASRGVWAAQLEPAWCELVGARAAGARPAPCLDAAPVAAWFCLDKENIYALCRISGLACVQLNQFQLLFLLRQVDKLSDLAAWLHVDASRTSKPAGNIVVGVVVPALELNLVLPSNIPGQESSRDLDSVPLDSSSLLDMKMGGSEVTVAPSLLDRDSGVHATQSIEIFTSQPLPAEEIPSPNPAMSFSGLTSMRRGLTSLVSSIDSAWTGRDDASTCSSDSDRYVVVGLASSPDDADIAFREFEHGKMFSGAEVAAEVVERSSSASDHSVTSSCRRRDVISTCTIRVTNINVVHQTTPDQSKLRMVADDVTSHECLSIPWDEFQSKFAMRARAWVESTVSNEDEFKPKKSPKLAARMTRTELPIPLNDKGEPIGVAPTEELLEAVVQDLSMSFNMSTLLALGEFFEDEIIQPPMPLEVLINNLKLHLIEDRVSRCISSPPPQPLNVDLTTIQLTRDTSGVVTLGPPARTPSTLASPATPQEQFEVEAIRSEVDRLSRENEELKRRLTTMAKIAEDNRELRSKVDESMVLRQCAHAAQQEAASLLADKRELLDTIRILQEQLGGRGKR